MATTSTIPARTWIDGVEIHVNDISLSSGQLTMASGKTAYANIIQCALRTRVGELPLDTAQGIPYFETVFQSPSLIPGFRAALQSRVEELDFVESVESVETDFDREQGILRYKIKVRTTNGDDIEVSSRIGKKAYVEEIVFPEGGGTMQTLIQDGEFYLPVHIDKGVQMYRRLTDSYDPDNGVQPAISDELYKKNPATGRFEEV